MAVEQSEAFKRAVEESRKLKQQPSVEEMLELYAFFKQGSQDPPFNPDNKPGMFDLKGKKKFQAWEAIQTMDPETAQHKYVELVERLKEKYGFEE
ncbi:Acyl-CoA-binding protein, ACBP [Ascosphaera apis ARSEF 7405]|uniref:Acyl-CoA-binding protein, ACBP n=1 Tax=Ascosphaera apis ARSEF 7405 TaxID=392613 RepID=A0A167YGD4_9EURO|nr:Acyl-CoA-binding protein, ACBP [Ascosphaera apis ARSEF 7405]